MDDFAQLLSLVFHQASGNYFVGLDPFRDLLRAEKSLAVVQFLEEQLPILEGKRATGIAFVLGEYYQRIHDLRSLRRLYTLPNARIREGLLNALWGEPLPGSDLGEGIVAMAIDACDDPTPAVRANACAVLMNQTAWKVDVTAARYPLLQLLSDPDDAVIHAAAAAVGNLAERKYELSAHIIPLRRNLHHPVSWIREMNAWALWKLSRRHDISAAIPDLVRLLLSDSGYNGPRKASAGALLHHGKKSPANALAVLHAMETQGERFDSKESLKLLVCLQATAV